MPLPLALAFALDGRSDAAGGAAADSEADDSSASKKSMIQGPGQKSAAMLNHGWGTIRQLVGFRLSVINP